ncbi:conserved Plasmodium protein, unknown function, partial [Plasmodium malariae]
IKKNNYVGMSSTNEKTFNCNKENLSKLCSSHVPNTIMVETIINCKKEKQINHISIIPKWEKIRSQESLLYELINKNDNKSKIKKFLDDSDKHQNVYETKDKEKVSAQNATIKCEEKIMSIKKKMSNSTKLSNIIKKENHVDQKGTNEITTCIKTKCKELSSIHRDKCSKKEDYSINHKNKNNLNLQTYKQKVKSQESLLYELININSNRIKIQNFLKQSNQYEASNNFQTVHENKVNLKENEKKNKIIKDVSCRESTHASRLKTNNNFKKICLTKNSLYHVHNSTKEEINNTREKKLLPKEQKFYKMKKISYPKSPPRTITQKCNDKIGNKNEMFKGSENKKGTEEGKDNTTLNTINNKIKNGNKLTTNKKMDKKQIVKNSNREHNEKRRNELNNGYTKENETKKRLIASSKKDKIIRYNYHIKSSNDQAEKTTNIKGSILSINKCTNLKWGNENKQNFCRNNTLIMKKENKTINQAKYCTHFKVPLNLQKKDNTVSTLYPLMYKTPFDNTKNKNNSRHDLNVTKAYVEKITKNNNGTKNKESTNIAGDYKIYNKNNNYDLVEREITIYSEANKVKRDILDIDLDKNVDALKNKKNIITPKFNRKRKISELRIESITKKFYIKTIFANSIMKSQKNSKKVISMHNQIANNEDLKNRDPCYDEKEMNSKKCAERIINTNPKLKKRYINILEHEKRNMEVQKHNVFLNETKQKVEIHIWNKTHKIIGNYVNNQISEAPFISHVLNQNVKEGVPRCFMEVQTTKTYEEITKINFSGILKELLKEEKLEEIDSFYELKKEILPYKESKILQRRANNYTISACLKKEAMKLKIVNKKIIARILTKTTVHVKYFYLKETSLQISNKVIFVVRNVSKEIWKIKGLKKMIIRLGKKKMNSLERRKYHVANLNFFKKENCWEREKCWPKEITKERLAINHLNKNNSERTIIKEQYMMLHFLGKKIYSKNVPIKFVLLEYLKKEVPMEKKKHKKKKNKITMIIIIMIIIKRLDSQNLKKSTKQLTMMRIEKKECLSWDIKQKLSIINKVKKLYLKEKKKQITVRKILSYTRSKEMEQKVVITENMILYNLSKKYIKKNIEKKLNNEEGKYITIIKNSQEQKLGERNNELITTSYINDIKKDIFKPQQIKKKDKQKTEKEKLLLSNTEREMIIPKIMIKENLQEMKKYIIMIKYLKGEIFKVGKGIFNVQPLNREPAMRSIKEVQVGTSKEIEVGTSKEIEVGISKEIEVGISKEIEVGISKEINVGTEKEIEVGISKEINVGTEREVPKERINGDIEKEILAIKYLIKEILEEIRNEVIKDYKIRRPKRTKKEKIHHKKMKGYVTIRDIENEHLKYKEKKNRPNKNIKDEINIIERINEGKYHKREKEKEKEKLENKNLIEIKDKDWAKEYINQAILVEDVKCEKEFLIISDLREENKNTPREELREDLLTEVLTIEDVREKTLNEIEEDEEEALTEKAMDEILMITSLREKNMNEIREVLGGELITEMFTI